MTSLISFAPNQLKNFYTYFYPIKQKDKIDMILEPLQAMIQLALLSVCPIGTKITIQENILYIQHPSIIQPISRWYKSDKKDDLLFLFQVIRRFVKWYNPLNKIFNIYTGNTTSTISQNDKSISSNSNTSTPNTTPIHSSVNKSQNFQNTQLQNSKNKKGNQNGNINSNNITPSCSPLVLSANHSNINEINTISLDSSISTLTSNLNNNENNEYTKQEDDYYINTTNKNYKYNNSISVELYKLIVNMAIKGLDNLLKTYGSSENNTIIQVIYMYKNLLQTNDNVDVDKIFSENGEKSINMDEIFINITKLYDNTLLNMIYNTLLIINREIDENNIINFIDGLNLLMSKNNNLIQSWIKVNLVF
jgi:hypothetical protein